jgi:hypothetical protein
MTDRRYRWSHVESALKQITPVSGGFSSAHRGITVLPDGTRVFVKAGVDDTTRRWATKEIAVYRFLNKYSYPYIPRLAAWNDEQTSFALEALLPDDGWDWSDSWNAERLDRTLDAMDALAAITVAGEDFTLFNLLTLDEDDDGWRQLATSPQLQRALLAKLRDTGRDDMADTIDFAASAEHSSRFVFRRDVLVHNDVRADNCAWNPHINGVRLDLDFDAVMALNCLGWAWFHAERYDLAASAYREAADRAEACGSPHETARAPTPGSATSPPPKDPESWRPSCGNAPTRSIRSWTRSWSVKPACGWS